MPAVAVGQHAWLDEPPCGSLCARCAELSMLRVGQHEQGSKCLQQQVGVWPRVLLSGNSAQVTDASCTRSEGLSMLALKGYKGLAATAGVGVWSSVLVNGDPAQVPNATQALIKRLCVHHLRTPIELLTPMACSMAALLP